MTLCYSDAITSIALFREGANSPATPAAHRLRAAYHWARLARTSSSESALDAYITTLMLLEKTITQSKSLEARHTYLSNNSILPRLELAELATDACSCAIDQGKIELAVELLEQGRATIMTQLGRYRTQLDNITAVDTRLANEFQRLSRRLDASIVKGDKMEAATDSLHDNVARCVTPTVEISLSKPSLQIPLHYESVGQCRRTDQGTGRVPVLPETYAIP